MAIHGLEYKGIIYEYKGIMNLLRDYKEIILIKYREKI